MTKSFSADHARGLLYQTYGPWALVTGASSGIGRAFARQLAAAGLNLVITARRKERLERLATELHRKHAVVVEPLALDLSDPEFLPIVAAACEGKNIGLVISNAGFGLKGLHYELPQETLDQMLNVNCRAPMKLAHYFLPRLLQRGRGGLVITASVEAFFGLPGSAAYSASKAFAKALGEALYGETLHSGVNTLVLCPGLTDTEAPALQGYNTAEMSGVKMPEEVAAEALEALGKRPVLISAAAKYRYMIRLLSQLPRRLTLALAAKAVGREQKK